MATELDFYSTFSKKIEDAINHTGTWVNKQLKWHKLRMRIKKDKTFPFIGCSNLRLPTAETEIRKYVSNQVGTLFNTRPAVQVIPSPSGSWDTAYKIEKFLDHLLFDILKIKEKVTVAHDQEAEKGFFLFKPYWKLETSTRLETISIYDYSIDEVLAFFDPINEMEDRMQILAGVLEPDLSDSVRIDNLAALEDAVGQLINGAEEVEIELEDVLYNFPDVALVSPERCFVPPDTGWNPQEAEFICHEIFVPLRVLQANASDRGKGWNKKAVDEIEVYKNKDTRSLTDAEKDMREGIERLQNSSEQVRIWEWYGWYDLNNDGRPEKVIFTLAPDFRKILRQISLSSKSGKFPFVKLVFELNDDRWFSHRGIPELLEDIIKEIDVQHNQKIDQQTIRNSPMFVYRAGMVNPNMVQFIPNQGIPIHGMGDLRNTIDLLNNNNPNVEFSYDREEQILNTKIVELLGNPNFTLQSLINRREPRTGMEVGLQNQAQQQITSLTTTLHGEAYGELFNFIWDLWCEHGPDEYEFAYFGPSGYEPIKLTREEIQGKWTIKIRANDQNSNPFIRLQKAQMLLGLVTDPLSIQLGINNPQHIVNAKRRILQEMDIADWEQFINPQPVPFAAPPQLPVSLTDQEEAQVLARHGVQPDVVGRALRKEEELVDRAEGEKSNGKSKDKGRTAKRA